MPRVLGDALFGRAHDDEGAAMTPEEEAARRCRLNETFTTPLLLPFPDDDGDERTRATAAIGAGAVQAGTEAVTKAKADA